MKTALLTTSTPLTFSDSQNAIANSFLFIRTLSKKILAPASSLWLWASSFCFVCNNFFLSSALSTTSTKQMINCSIYSTYVHVHVNCQTSENKIPMPMARFSFFKVFPSSAAGFRYLTSVETVCEASFSNVDDVSTNSCCGIREPFVMFKRMRPMPPPAPFPPLSSAAFNASARFLSSFYRVHDGLKH